MANPIVINAKNGKIELTVVRIFLSHSGCRYRLKFKTNASAKAMNGGNFNIGNRIDRGLGCLAANHELTKTPAVTHITKVPIVLIIIPIFRPSEPYNISKIGKPTKEILPIPAVTVRPPSEFRSIGFNFPIIKKNNKLPQKTIQADNTGQIWALVKIVSGICNTIKTGIKKRISNLFNLRYKFSGSCFTFFSIIPNPMQPSIVNSFITCSFGY